MSLFGFGKGVSPGLQSKVARKAVLMPSLQLATDELKREGIDLNIKTVRRISVQCGMGLLSLRKHRVETFLDGKMPAGDTLKGKHVCVQVDGGRIKIRGKTGVRQKNTPSVNEDGLHTEDAPGRSIRRPGRTFASEWREPKMFTIFVVDPDTGKMSKEIKPTIDGTLMGPDEVAEMIAMELHRLGAASAERVSFVADGAPWIWDRIDRIVRLAKLESVKRDEVLDCCHAVHHVSQALASLGMTAEERLPVYRAYRTQIRNGHWRQVVEELAVQQHPADDKKHNKELETELNYLRKHGEAGRLSYPSFRRSNVPCGSGSIESTIRRVLNLRLKSNGMAWKQENAEAMIQLRAQAISDRWDDSITDLLLYKQKHPVDGYQWTFKTKTSKPEAEEQTAV